jgi:hypothetical protein
MPQGFALFVAVEAPAAALRVRRGARPRRIRVHDHRRRDRAAVGEVEVGGDPVGHSEAVAQLRDTGGRQRLGCRVRTQLVGDHRAVLGGHPRRPDEGRVLQGERHGLAGRQVGDRSGHQGRAVGRAGGPCRARPLGRRHAGNGQSGAEAVFRTCRRGGRAGPRAFHRRAGPRNRPHRHQRAQRRGERDQGCGRTPKPSHAAARPLPDLRHRNAPSGGSATKATSPSAHSVVVKPDGPGRRYAAADPRRA